jgi:hypothetical protein
MKTPHWYISGPHARDYYLLLDEEAGHIFATRLETRLREARASLLEIWSDDADKQVWYVFETSSQRRAGE